MCFRLAQMLFEDRQNEDVLAQFCKLQAGGLPPQIANLADLYSYKRNRVYLSFEKSF